MLEKGAPGGHCGDSYTGALSFNEVFANHLKMTPPRGGGEILLRNGDKPLPDIMMTKFRDAIKRHYVTMTYWVNLKRIFRYDYWYAFTMKN